MNDQANQYQQLIAKCWADDAFKQRLLADPAGTLAAEGMAVPEGVTLRVVENTAREMTLVIPPRPTDLSDEAMAGVAGGMEMDFIVRQEPVSGGGDTWEAQVARRVSWSDKSSIISNLR